MARSRSGGIARVMIFVGLLAAVLTGALLLAARLMSPAFIVERLQQAVKEGTGRTLVVKGEPAVSFFPRISVVLPEVRLSNPPGMAPGDFLRVRRLELEMEPWPLLQRELVIRRLRMVAPAIHLQVDGAGRASWRFPAAAAADGNAGGDAAGAAAGLLRGIRLAPVVVEQGQVLFSDARTGTRQRLDDVDVVVQLATPASPMRVKGGASWRQRRLSFTLFVKDLSRLTGAGAPVEVFLKVGDAKVEYTGLAGFGDGLRLAGNLSASGSSLRDLLHWLQVGVSPRGAGLGAFSLAAGVDATGTALTLQRLRLKLDGSNARGTVKLDMSGPVTTLKAALGVDRIVTDTYLGPPPKPAGSGRRVGEGGGWSKASVIADLPRTLKADVRVSVNQLRHRRLKLGPGSARFMLADGTFTTTLNDMRFYDGTLSGRLAVTTGGRKPKVAVLLRFAGVQARPFLDDLAGFRHLSGRLTGEVDVKSLGRSQLEIVGNLTGLANLTFREGKVHGVDLVKLMEMVQQGIVQGWNTSEQAATDFVELAAKFVIVDGIAGVRELRMKGPLVQVKGRGEVDLLRQRLDLSLDGALVKRRDGREKTLLRMPAPLLVKGSWQQPQIYPDIAGILKNPQAALQRFRRLMQGLGGNRPQQALRKAANKAEKLGDRLKRKAAEAERALKDGKLPADVQRRLDDATGGRDGQVSEEATRQMQQLLQGILGR